MQSDIRGFYDRWTPVMVDAAGTTLQGGLVKRSREAPDDPQASAVYLAELAGVRPDHHVLDAGCGVGGPAIAIAEAIPGVVVDGVTVSDVQVRMARKLAARAGLTDRVRVHLADFHALPFPDHTFDVALYLEVTGYSHDRKALYRECARVLRPGGTVYVKDLFCREEPLEPRQRRAMAAFDELWACVASPTLGETASAMERAGLVQVAVREYPHVGTDWFYESMVTRDDGGLLLNRFGESFLRLFADLPAFFGEARARKPPHGSHLT